MISKPVDIPVKSDVTGMIEIKKKDWEILWKLSFNA